jgi:hypothetical protein
MASFMQKQLILVCYAHTAGIFQTFERKEEIMHFPTVMCNCAYQCMMHEDSEWSVCVQSHDLWQRHSPNIKLLCVISCCDI